MRLSRIDNVARRLENGSGNPDFRHPELRLPIRINNHCILCGDGWERLTRQCLKYTICDACHVEYCDCADYLADAMALEDVARLSEDSRIPLLRERKERLKMRGKDTNSIPLIIKEPSLDIHEGTTPIKYHSSWDWEVNA